jgi:glycosyltransferase involved in cell wall biosynthesis
VRYLLAQPELRKQMGAHGQAFVQQQLSRERLIRDIEKLYRALVSDAP